MVARMPRYSLCMTRVEAIDDEKYTSLDIHRALFPDGPPPYRTDEELRKELEDAILEDDARVRME